nr:TPA_asm: m88.5 sORF 1 [Murid betaherpesvirus 1]DBA08035.1 TPA_asm: m88.5 sORF 1 [Murid betaherpesvirus 1]
MDVSQSSRSLSSVYCSRSPTTRGT